MAPNQPWSAVEDLQTDPTEALRQGKEAVDQMVGKASNVAPANAFMFAALASIAVSAFLQLTGKRQWSLFIGHWAPSFMLFGIFFKLNKKLGSD